MAEWDPDGLGVKVGIRFVWSNVAKPRWDLVISSAGSVNEKEIAKRASTEILPLVTIHVYLRIADFG